MNAMKYVILIVLGVCIIPACDINQSMDERQKEEQVPENIEQKINSEDLGEKLRFLRKQDYSNWVVIPFKGNFETSGADGFPRPDDSCAHPAWLDTQVGEGEAKFLGPFSFHSSFCINLTDLLPPLGGDGMLTEGEAMPFYGGITTFTFSNGDKLFARGGDAVLPTDNPDISAEFQNSFAITGGTGRLEGAMGGATTQSLVSFGVATEHSFSGVLVLPRHRGIGHIEDDDEER